MRKTFLAVAAGVAVWAVSLSLPARQSAPTPERMTFLITLGLEAKAAERWDGSVRVTGGRLVSLEGRQFSEGDRLAGPERWVATTRTDQVAPYADIHYTEMRPGAVPAVLHHPVGVWLVVEPGADARVAVETAQGRFEFRASEIGVAPSRYLGGRVEVRRAPTVEKLSLATYEDDEPDRKSTRLNSSHIQKSRMPSSA